MPTRSSISLVRSSISDFEKVPCAISGSETMSTIRCRGFNDANGSWNTGWINRARSRMGLHFVETSSALGIARILKRGGVLGMLADRAVTGVGERVPFFGRPALLPSAHVALALRTGAVLIPAFAHRDGEILRAVFEPELVLRRTGDRDADLLDGMRRWATALEPHVAMAPEQWSVFEPVWRR